MKAQRRRSLYWVHRGLGRTANAAWVLALAGCQVFGNFDDLPIADCPQGTSPRTSGDSFVCVPADGAQGSGGGGGGDGAGNGGAAGAGGQPPTTLRTPIALEDYALRLQNDLASVPSGERGGLFYVDLHAAYNNLAVADGELGAYADAALKLLNHLDVRSTAPSADGAAVIVDADGLPLAIRFDAGRFNLDKQRDVVDTIVRLDNRQDFNTPFECEIPTIPVLDFLYVASSDSVFNVFGDDGGGTYESAYSNIVWRRLLEDAGIAQPGQLVFDPIVQQQFISNGFTNLSNNFWLFELLEATDPNTLSEDGINALYNQNTGDKTLVRGCVPASNLTTTNRCIDRYALSPPSEGVAYISWDVLAAESSNESKDFFKAGFVGPANPPGFELVRPQDGFTPFFTDGGEYILRLKNSMLGFASFNANFQLLSDTSILKTESSGPVSAAQCFSCHEHFTSRFEDSLLPTTKLPGSEYSPDSFAVKLSQEQAEWDDTFERDSNRYLDALRSIYFTKNSGPLSDGVWSLGSRYLNALSAADVVAELGLPDVATLDERIAAVPDVQAKLGQNGSLARGQFTLNYQELVDQVARKNQDFLRGCVARSASTVK